MALTTCSICRRPPQEHVNNRMGTVELEVLFAGFNLKPPPDLMQNVHAHDTLVHARSLLHADKDARLATWLDALVHVFRQKPTDDTTLLLRMYQYLHPDMREWGHDINGFAEPMATVCDIVEARV